MFRLLVSVAALFTAYKVGENKAKLEQLDFFITKITGQASRLHLIEYASIDNNGNLLFSDDMNIATVLNYWDAMALKGMLKKFAPSTNVQLESVSSLITVQQQ